MLLAGFLLYKDNVITRCGIAFGATSALAQLGCWLRLGVASEGDKKSVSRLNNFRFVPWSFSMDIGSNFLQSTQAHQIHKLRIMDFNLMHNIV